MQRSADIILDAYVMVLVAMENAVLIQRELMIGDSLEMVRGLMIAFSPTPNLNPTDFLLGVLKNIDL